MIGERMHLDPKDPKVVRVADAIRKCYMDMGGQKGEALPVNPLSIEFHPGGPRFEAGWLSPPSAAYLEVRERIPDYTGEPPLFQVVRGLQWQFVDVDGNIFKASPGHELDSKDAFMQSQKSLPRGVVAVSENGQRVTTEFTPATPRPLVPWPSPVILKEPDRG
jgi:hypothetical protein